MTDARLDAARQRRADAAGAIEALARQLDAAAADLAGRLHQGAVLHAVGTGVNAVDAAHVRVEFLHPVTVGRRAIPARVGAPAGGDDAVVVSLRLHDDPEALAQLEASSRDGTLVVDVTAGSARSAPWADHPIDLATADVLIGRELQVTTYHLLWEMVHEHLDARPGPGDGRSGDGDDPGDRGDALDRLYPMLDVRRPASDASEHVRRSIVSKAEESARLRAEVSALDAAAIARAAAAIERAAASRRSVWCVGNGGSSTDAAAFAHLLRTATATSAPIRAEALADDVATLTAMANDLGFDVALARMLAAEGRPGDVVVAFSTSGDSANVVAALETARSRDMVTIGFAGNEGGRMAALHLDEIFVVPSASVHRVQEAQTTLAHLVVELLR